MYRLIKVFNNFIMSVVINGLPLFAAFLSEADVLILSLMGKHFHMEYVMFRLFVAICIYFAIRHGSALFISEEKHEGTGRI